MILAKTAPWTRALEEFTISYFSLKKSQHLLEYLKHTRCLVLKRPIRPVSWKNPVFPLHSLIFHAINENKSLGTLLSHNISIFNLEFNFTLTSMHIIDTVLPKARFLGRGMMYPQWYKLGIRDGTLVRMLSFPGCSFHHIWWGEGTELVHGWHMALISYVKSVLFVVASDCVLKESAARCHRRKTPLNEWQHLPWAHTCPCAVNLPALN